jgi:hypothetical protein
MNRRAFVTGLAAVLAAPLAAEAQPAGKVYRVGLFHVGLDHDHLLMRWLQVALTPDR